ncbi:MAG: c-type cytochrome biogenesis protein CcsB [Thermodesulfobacteriota bacterium]|nr:c-type cytochrome biogenesis protein CcsB [Thermodesulfobacteriota bacterium]
MTSSNLLSIITFVYGLSAFTYLFAWIFKKPDVARLGTWTAIIGWGGNTAGIILRWIESYRLGIGHAPLSNLYESLVFFAFTLALIYLIIEFRYRNRIIGAFIMPLVFLAMAYASLSPNISDRIQPLIPALKSNWLIAHVIACFVGYAAFAVAFGLSIMYLVKQTEAVEATGGWLDLLPKKQALDELTHQMVMFGFIFLTAGIITGAVWANSAWGRYWGWDPKETWSLITWFVYATLLHARLMRGWYGKRIAYLSIIGFAAVIFTYFGVNYLPGLHSYGSV